MQYEVRDRRGRRISRPRAVAPGSEGCEVAGQISKPRQTRLQRGKLSKRKKRGNSPRIKSRVTKSLFPLHIHLWTRPHEHPRVFFLRALLSLSFSLAFVRYSNSALNLSPCLVFSTKAIMSVVLFLFRPLKTVLWDSCRPYYFSLHIVIIL